MRALRVHLVAMMLAAAIAAAVGDAFGAAAGVYRRLVTVNDYKPTHLPGDDVGVVTMPTGGLVSPDGNDIRVTTVDGAIVPSRVLMIGPGDVARVAFALRQGTSRYYIHFGNTRLEPLRELQIRRGVLLEMWENPGGGVRTLQQAQEALGGVKKLLGRDFRDRIFQGHNPFGPDDRMVAVYTGWLDIAQKSAGTHVFACSSQNAGFVLIDDKLILDNGGVHGAHSHVQQEASVNLSPGLHKATFLQVSGGGDPTVVLAWRTPVELEKNDRKRFHFVPPGAFAPVFRGMPGMIEQVGKTAGIDFLYEHLGETFVDNRYYERLAFNALVMGDNPKGIKWKWDFGDGQTSDQPEVQHVYLTHGEYAVELRGTLGSATMTRVNRIVVQRPWDKVAESRLDLISEYSRIVMGYDFKTLGPDRAAEAIVLLGRANLPDAVIRAGDAFVGLSQAPAQQVTRVLPIYVERLLAAREYAKAQAAYLRAAEMTNDPAVCATMLVAAGRVTLENLDDPARASEIFASAVKRYEAMTTSPAIRDARIGMGDVWRAQGEYDKAREAYAAARQRESTKVAEKAFLRGDFARHVEDYIRTSDLTSAQEYLDRWASAWPADKLDGYWSLLEARLLFARSMFDAAAMEAHVLAKVNPASNYAAELLMIACNSHIKLSQSDKAAACLRQIVKDYPESPLAAEAARALQGGTATRPK